MGESLLGTERAPGANTLVRGQRRKAPMKLTFVLRDAYMHSAYLLSKDGWMSHAGIVSKRLKISSNFFLGLVALPLWFPNTALWLRNSNGKGSLSLGWIFRSQFSFS